MVPRWLLLATLALAYAKVANSDRNRFVTVPHTSSCGQQFSEDGLLIRSSGAPSEQCIVTITPGYNFRKQLLIRFEQVSLPGQGSIQPSITLRRRLSLEPMLVVRQNSSGVTGKLYPVASTVDFEFRNILSTSVFKIVITRTEDDLLCSGEHFCTSTRYCIDKDLRCDHIDHCGDNSDETHYSCHLEVDYDSQRLPIGVVVSGAVVSLVVVVAISTIIGICRRRRLRGLASRRAPMLVTQAAPVNVQSAGVGFMPVPQSDPCAPAPYPQQPSYWPSPAAAGVPVSTMPVAVAPPPYDAAILSSPRYPPAAYPPAGAGPTGSQPPHYAPYPTYNAGV